MLAPPLPAAVQSAKPTPAPSAWRPGKGIDSGADLSLACSTAAGATGKIACVYFLNGVLNDISTSAMSADQRDNKPYKPVLCIPSSVSLDTQLAAVSAGVTLEPGLRAAPAAALVRFVYGRNWACK